MRKLTIEQALKTPRIKFLASQKQLLEISKVIKKNWNCAYILAICIDSDLKYSYFTWEEDFNIHLNEQIQLIKTTEQSMTSKKIEITPPEGYEIDEGNSTFSCIQFRPIPIKTINKWEDIGSINGWFVNDVCNIKDVVDFGNAPKNRNVFKTRDQAESCLVFSMYSQLKEHNNSYEVLCEYLDRSKPMLEILFDELTEQYVALFKLIKLRDIVNDGWKREFGETYFGIYNYNQELHINVIQYTHHTLSFKTREITQKFINDNINLLNIAKQLL